MAAPSPSSTRTRRADPAAGSLTDPGAVPGDAVEDGDAPDEVAVPDEMVGRIVAQGPGSEAFFQFAQDIFCLGMQVGERF